MQEWHRQRAASYRSRKELPEGFSLQPEEILFFEKTEASHAAAPDFSPDSARRPAIGFTVPRYYLSLAGAEPGDPIRRQCIPDVRELDQLPWEEADPLHEKSHTISERIIHRYRDRILILTTDECAMYCRHCFRRYFASRSGGALSETQLQEGIRYLEAHPEVHEVILSGGDPLTLEDRRLLHILEEMDRRVSRTLVFRLATRVPVVLPSRVTPELAEALGVFSSLFIITQFNHVREITPESRRAVELLIRAGLPVLNQAVLLKGINDSVEALRELFQGLLDIKVKPYYLFQGDLAPGTSHFRLPLSKGMELYRRLRREISGLAMPVYAVDLPGGGGKIPLSDTYFEGVETGEGARRYGFTGPDGKKYYYPVEER